MSSITIPKNKKFKTDIKIPIDMEKTRIGFVTGAGVSVGSGLPTYYGLDGHYTSLNEKPEDVLNEHNMRHNPPMIWDAIGQLIHQGLLAQPNISHKTIASIQKMVNNSQVLTQNVDGLHKKAGSTNIIDMHGLASRCYCSNCKKSLELILMQTKDVLPSYRKGSAPICPKCNKPAMVPDIVAFDGLVRGEDYLAVNSFYSEPVDICFVVGTQVFFPYIEMALYDAKQKNKNALIIDINPDPYYQNLYADYIFRESADSFFERIILS